MKFIATVMACWPFLMVYAANDHDFTVALVGKTINDSFYLQSFNGCAAFAKNKPQLRCIYDGPKDYQDPRSQAIVVTELIDEGIDGLMISVTDSNHLSHKVLQQAQALNIPIITFDSDLLPEHSAYRMAYVGTNNQAFGMALGNYAKKIVTNQQSQICIHSGHPSSPNLNARIAGVRLALSGGKSTARLTGHSGWSEYARCPLYSLGKRDLAVTQLAYVLQHNESVINVAIAGFAQFSPDYIARIRPYRDKIKAKEIIIVSADTEAVQLTALQKGLSTINIGQRPYKMGRLATQLLYQYLNEGKMPGDEFNYLGFHYCLAENYARCTKTNEN